jgi:hypothetical protein
MTTRRTGWVALTAAAAIASSAVLAMPAAGADPTPASTSTPTSTSTAPTAANSAARLATIQAVAKVAITARLSALNATIPVVTANPVITDADRATLLATLNHDVDGLTTLEAKIAADSTVTAAQADYQSIFTGFRVYALALPQVRYATAVDDITALALPKLTNAQSTLASLLAGADAAKNTAAVQAAMTDLATQITAITTTTNGLSASVLALTPAQYDANHALLSQPRAKLVQARADVRSATADIATVLKALQ